MRHLMLIRVDSKGYEAGERPPAELEAAVGALLGEWSQQGILLTAEGLRPSAEGKRLGIGTGPGVIVSDGPFTEAKEVIGGFCLLRTASDAQAVELTRVFLEAHAKVMGADFPIECELRRIDGAEAD